MWIGSSPLARGLLKDVNTTVDKFRIIPARAGFTQVHPEQSDTPEDHPRSRGVYGLIRVKARLIPGSSPLARGLLRRLSQTPRNIRIIPARAGFTRKMLPWHASPSDHPRSRGVYRLPGIGSP